MWGKYFFSISLLNKNICHLAEQLLPEIFIFTTYRPSFPSRVQFSPMKNTRDKIAKAKLRSNRGPRCKSVALSVSLHDVHYILRQQPRPRMYPNTLHTRAKVSYCFSWLVRTSQRFLLYRG